jgi:hypothetical protein
MPVIAYKFQSPDGSYWYIRADDERTLEYWRDKRNLIPLTDDKARISEETKAVIEMQQPGDIDDHISMLISACESAGHALAGAGERASVRECELLLKAEIDRGLTAAYAEGRNDEREERRRACLGFFGRGCKSNATAGGAHGELRPHCPYCGETPDMSREEENEFSKNMLPPTVEDVMFAVYDYAMRSDGIYGKEGEERVMQRERMLAKAGHLRLMLNALKRRSHSEGRADERGAILAAVRAAGFDLVPIGPVDDLRLVSVLPGTVPGLNR